MKRCLLMSIAVMLVCLAGGQVLSAGRETSDSLQTWIAANAVSVRTVDVADENFGDLEPLAKAIGSAQVIALGEPGHGAGTSFAAKVRLIEFLHQRMGFDVLVWESGMYDVGLSQAGMRGSDDGVAAARRGIFQLWSGAEEVKPLFDFIKASQATAHPLAVAGFDIQVTADGSMERFATDLRTFVQALKDPALRDEAAASVDQALAARTRLFSSKFEAKADLTALDDAARSLLGEMRHRHGAFQDVHDAGSIGLMEHCIENMRLDARQRYDAAHASGPEVARENRRDARNFENLRWLIQEYYPGKKFIVWAHNVHVMKAGYSSDFRTVHVEPKADDMKPTGAFLARWLGKQSYTVGMTAYQGQDALVTGGPATVIDPAVAGSLEGQLHALGRHFVFLDLRAGKIPPLSARIPKYDSNDIADAGRVYDGIFYIDQMAPATKPP